jgi:hypothetical protein
MECSLALATNADDAASPPALRTRPSDLDKEPNASGSIGHITSWSVHLRMGLMRSLLKATLIVRSKRGWSPLRQPAAVPARASWNRS